MAIQIKMLTDAVALPAKNGNNKENNPNKPTGGGVGEKKQYTKPRTMGRYCWSHGFHPAGENHMSATCTWKKDGHDIAATQATRNGGCVHWPIPIHVRLVDQTHATYASKAAPAS